MIIGVTGKIATGKSSVSSILERKGYFLFDSDVVYHRLLKENADLKKELTDFLGMDIEANNEIDTGRMIKKINQENIGKLNDITHKYVINEITETIRQYDNIVIEAAIPVKIGFIDVCDKIVTTVCTPKVQLERLKKRNKYTENDLL
ncbi:MAG: dephospho-CoA kinase, partial [Clostridia bacterium]|nr:dephospho-CoA kinase [Clostridia bacterium]